MRGHHEHTSLIPQNSVCRVPVLQQCEPEILWGYKAWSDKRKQADGQKLQMKPLQIWEDLPDARESTIRERLVAALHFQATHLWQAQVFSQISDLGEANLESTDAREKAWLLQQDPRLTAHEANDFLSKGTLQELHLGRARTHPSELGALLPLHHGHHLVEKPAERRFANWDLLKWHFGQVDAESSQRLLNQVTSNPLRAALDLCHLVAAETVGRQDSEADAESHLAREEHAAFLGRFEKRPSADK
mmetsp:Transcript_2616/g.5091  ORF Transcript_2616/g.5091 Transcript_2616/m.5091 type:complete len:246 (-) Transcript_2616:187-924(-)